MWLDRLGLRGCQKDKVFIRRKVMGGLRLEVFLKLTYDGQKGGMTTRRFWIHYCVGPYPEPNEFNPHPPTLPKIHSNIILPSMPRSSVCALPFRLLSSASECTSEHYILPLINVNLLTVDMTPYIYI
jgi:hypothetical protein